MSRFLEALKEKGFDYDIMNMVMKMYYLLKLSLHLFVNLEHKVNYKSLSLIDNLNHKTCFERLKYFGKVFLFK